MSIHPICDMNKYCWALGHFYKSKFLPILEQIQIFYSIYSKPTFVSYKYAVMGSNVKVPKAMIVTKLVSSLNLKSTRW